MADILNSFHDTTYKKYLFRHINNIVQVAKESYQRDLNQKRQRLKQLLDAEDLAYENEFRHMVQGRLDETIRQRQQTLLQIRNEKIYQEKNLIARKKAQRLIENSDEIRTIISKNLLREAKACNLAQIEEKAIRKVEEDKMETFWLNIRDKTLTIDNSNQQYEDRTRKEISLIDQNLLLQQMSEKNPKIKEDTKSEFNLPGIGCLFYKRQTDEDKKVLQRQKNIENQKEMLKYQALRQKLIDENCQAETRFIETINQQVQEEIRKEEQRQRIKPKTAEIFLGYHNEIKQEKIKELQAEIDLIKTQHAEFDCKLVKQRNKHHQDRKNLKLKSHDILLGQLDTADTEKYNRTIMKNEENIIKDEIFLRDTKRLKDQEADRKIYCKKYGDELKVQAANHTIEQYQQILKDQEETRKLINQSEVDDEVALQLISKDDRHLKTHANWKLIECECKKPN